MKRLILVAALVIGLASCGYDGSYRYECQDPENWDDSDCYPPVCLVDGMCTETLIGFDPREETPEVTIEPAPVEETPETTVAP
ncbi:MAG: hypothetical protein ACO3CH_00355 [Ilumatobacteraceae bacterium]